MIGYAITLTVLCTLMCSLQGTIALHMYQLESYQLRRFRLWRSKRYRKLYCESAVYALLWSGIWAAVAFGGARDFWFFAVAVVYAMTQIVVATAAIWKKSKKPLVYTKRAVRLIFLEVAYLMFVSASVGWSVYAEKLPIAYGYLAFTLSVLAAPVVFYASALTMQPIERVIKAAINLKTKRILSARRDLIIVAITGSYGKTTVKNILAEMLSERYSVLASKGSYNTPMGLALTVRDLKPEHQVLIAEFGARHLRDISELSRLVKPTHGIITAVGSQHLETFRTEERLLNTKLDLARAIEDGVLVYGADSAVLVSGLDALSLSCRTVGAGCAERAEVRVEKLSASRYGLSFELRYGAKTVDIQTGLFGAHNAVNIALAAAMAIQLGITEKQLTAACERLRATPHRLELREENGLLIVDDSFNASIEGTRAAIAAISTLPNRKVILTAGIVELGEYEQTANEELGRRLASQFSVVLLVGKRRTEPIRRGLEQAGFSGTIRAYDSLDEAQTDFKNVLRADDVLLIENDLPDNYD